ncbi:MAG: hypothetical protein ABUS49_08590, partial [Acidobacteriota bacterium]
MSRTGGAEGIDEIDLLAELTTGGRVKGRRTFVETVTRPNVAIAVMKTLDIQRAGGPAAGEETRGPIVVRKTLQLRAGAFPQRICGKL